MLESDNIIIPTETFYATVDATIQAERNSPAISEQFGREYKARASKVGDRLNQWYRILIIVIGSALFFLCFAGFAFRWFFLPLVRDFCSIAKNGCPDSNDLFMLFVLHKLSIAILFFAIIIWILNRISKLQTLRAVYADREVMANTMQIIYETGNQEFIRNMNEYAIKEMFSSCIEKLQKHKKQKNISTLDEIKNVITDLSDVVKNMLKKDDNENE